MRGVASVTVIVGGCVGATIGAALLPRASAPTWCDDAPHSLYDGYPTMGTFKEPCTHFATFFCDKCLFFRSICSPNVYEKRSTRYLRYSILSRLSLNAPERLDAGKL